MIITSYQIKSFIFQQAFVAVSCLFAVALANQSSHQAIKHGNAPTVSHSVHKAHGAHHAVVAAQPHAAPQDVHNPYAGEKYGAAVHAPAHVPVHAPAYGHPAVHHAIPHPVHHAVHHGVHHAAPYHPAPAYHKPAPVYHPAPAPYHAPVVHKPAPYHAPVVHKPAPYVAPVVHKPAPYVAPVVHKPVVHPAPAYHKPAPYHEPAYDGPAVYQYGYAVQDDYSKANFAANENRDGDVVTGEYRVALPDGRTQIVTYTANGYDGYVADVKYEGVAQYPEYKPAPYHAPKPAPYHA